MKYRKLGATLTGLAQEPSAGGEVGVHPAAKRPSLVPA